MAGFEDLKVWQLAADLTVDVYGLVKRFPVLEKFGLSPQLLRSVNSIGANIAEATGRYHYKDKVKFLYNARGSLVETEHHLIIANRVGYISGEDLQKLRVIIKDLGIKLNNFITSLSKSAK